MAYCSNRGGMAGSNEYSISAQTLSECAEYVYTKNMAGVCGYYFSFGKDDGWCDCVEYNENCEKKNMFNKCEKYNENCDYDVYKLNC